MEENSIVKYEGSLIKTIENAIRITNKLLTVENNDVVPLNIGFETSDGLMSVIFPVNTIIPVQKKLVFTSDKNQNFIVINLFQGFSKKISENKNLMRFRINYEPLNYGFEFQIEVVFDIDLYGILSVSTLDNKSKIIIEEFSSGVSKDDIQQMLKEKDKRI